MDNTTSFNQYYGPVGVGSHLNGFKYLPYQTPPYSSPGYSYSWTEVVKPPPSPSEENNHHFHHSQYMRFPTPPVTPPRSQGFATPPPSERKQRTHSVIMKVSQGQNLEHFKLTSDPETATYSSTEDSHSMNHMINISGSDSSSPASDFICAWQDCGRYFESLESLAQHVTQIHAVANTEDGLYYCRWHGCQRTDRGFNARYKMLVHVRTHTKEKPHKCHLCEKSFSRAENLKIHIRSHSGEKPYKCTFEGCTKAYSNSSDRFKHTRTHTMEKPYKCKVPGCQKRYTDPSSLRKHVKTFKHSTQIMENNLPTKPSDQEPTSPTKANTNFPESSKLLNKEATSSFSQLPYESMKSFYMPERIHQEEDSDIVMEKLPLNNFYERNSSHSNLFWLPEEALVKNYPAIYNEAYYHLPYHQSHHHHHNHVQSYPMDLEVERPLDLRVHKVQ